MPDSPLVSIVIPCFNQGRFLGEAISSALAQTHRPIEILVADGGSRDDSVEVAQRYARVHPEIRVLANVDAGRSATFNRGIQHAGGQFVAKLDADDRLDPRFVEFLLAALRTDAAVGFAYSHIRLFGAEQGTLLCQPFRPGRSLLVGAYSVTALIRRSVFDKAGYFDPHLEVGEDGEWYLRCIRAGVKGVLVPKPLLEYRRYPPGAGRTLPEQGRKAVRALFYGARKHRLGPVRTFAILGLTSVLGFCGRAAPVVHDVLRLTLYKVGIGPLYFKSAWFRRNASRFVPPSAIKEADNPSQSL